MPSSGNPSSSSLNLSYSSDQTPSTATFVNSTEDSYGSEHEEDEGNDDGPELIVRAMHDFVPQQQNATCLSFSAGETIRVLNRDPSGWWDGEIDGRRGWFPSNYVAPIGQSDENSTVVKQHGRSMSDTTALNPYASKAGTTGPERQPTGRKASASVSVVGSTMANGMLSPVTNHTPQLMIPLLNGLQLLQNTTLARRVSHYQPAVGCIIQCIRALLQHTDCLARGAPLLRKYPVIAQERKRVLAELALLVSQSKKASSPELATDEERDREEELMLRLGGQVFARVRRFLAVIVQCGVDFPDRSLSASVGDTSTSETVCDEPKAPLGRDSDSVRKQYGFNNDEEAYYPVIGSQKQSHSKQNSIAYSDKSTSTSRTDKRTHQKASSVVHPRYRGGHMSLGSTSSFSSFSSLESPNTPATPSFPEGPCTATQIHQALGMTHDSLLSTIAAFIGHVHQHSRAAHASSTGHLFALVRQIVDVVCRLLTVVDAVMGVEAIPVQKRASLEVTKENLYQMACALADAVREMATSAGLPAPDEEDERRHLLKVATDALKAGSDCVSAVKICLVRPSRVPPYTIILPPLSDSPPTESTATMAPEKSSDRKSYQAQNGNSDGTDESVAPETLDQLHEQVQMGYATTTEDYDEEGTAVQDTNGQPSPPGGRTPKAGFLHDRPTLSPFAPSRDRQSFISALNDGMPGDAIDEREEMEDESEGVGSPSTPSPPSSQRFEDGGPPWESKPISTLEDKLINGDLPSIPQSGDEDEVSLAWALSHDYAPQDVAYNNEGQLVGATLEALVEKLTPHDAMMDASLSAVFFLTFRLFTTPLEFAEAVVARFGLSLPSGLSDEHGSRWMQQKLLPIRMRVQNLLKLWVETYWRPTVDDEAIPVLQAFVRGPLADVFKGQAQRLDDLLSARASRPFDHPISPVTERQRINERLRDVGVPINTPITVSSSTETPRPIMTKTLLSSLRAHSFTSIAVTEFDALELARQLTLIESNLYCKITAEEVLEMGRQDASPAINVKAVTTLSTAITGWVSESILDEHDVKKRMLLVKFFIKVADVSSLCN